MANYYYLLLVVVELISSLGDALLLFAISGHYQQRRFRAEWLRFVHLRGHDMTSLGRRCRQQRYILKNDLVAVTDRLIREIVLRSLFLLWDGVVKSRAPPTLPRNESGALYLIVRF